ncbi:MAG: hypothetical protein K2R98_03325 [Gemmataceae bacterium]|nr:hypothetical protein [Gemmataceae bacterium]
MPCARRSRPALSWSRLLQCIFPVSRPSVSQSLRRGVVPWLEALEDRNLPSGITITVTGTGGGAGTYNSGTQQATTLAAAVAQANADDAGDTIVFQSGLSGAINLSTASGGVGTLTLSGDMTIRGRATTPLSFKVGRFPERRPMPRCSWSAPA